MNAKRLPLLLVPLVALALLAVWVWRDEPGDPGVLEFSGNVEITELDLAFKFPGRIVELTAVEGETVLAGMLLARVDDDQLQAQRVELLALIDGVRSRERELQALIRFQQANLEAQTRLRQAEVAQAEAVLDQLEEGSRRQEIEQARAAVSSAEAEAARAAADWERAQRLFAAEDISTAQRDLAEAAWKRSEAEVSRVREVLALVEEGPRRQDLAAARAGVERARAGLSQAAALELEIVRTRRSLETLAAEAATLEARVAQLDTRIADCRIEAPMTGVVLKRPAELGEVVASGTPVLTLGDLSRPWIRGYISGTQLGLVKLGDRVEVRTDSFPDKVYEGRVVYVSDEAEFTPKQIETREERVRMVYRVKVEVENPQQELKLNMPVDARLLTGSAVPPREPEAERR